MAAFGYQVMSGVRRCVAAREAGRHDIPAVIYQSGQPPITTRVPLDELYCGKDEIPRDPRYITDTEYPTQVLGTEPPPIEIIPFRSPTRHRYFTPVRAVRLV